MGGGGSEDNVVVFAVDVVSCDTSVEDLGRVMFLWNKDTVG